MLSALQHKLDGINKMLVRRGSNCYQNWGPWEWWKYHKAIHSFLVTLGCSPCGQIGKLLQKQWHAFQRTLFGTPKWAHTLYDVSLLWISRTLWTYSGSHQGTTVKMLFKRFLFKINALGLKLGVFFSILSLKWIFIWVILWFRGGKTTWDYNIRKSNDITKSRLVHVCKKRLIFLYKTCL